MKGWARYLFWVTLLGLCNLTASGQIAIVFDPERAGYTEAANIVAGRLYNEIHKEKSELVMEKARTVRSLMIVQLFDDLVYSKQLEADDGQVEQTKKLYLQTMDIIDEMWEHYDRVFLQTKDSVRMRTEETFNKFKEVSDYRVDQIDLRYQKYITGKRFSANNKERLTVLQDCYDEMRTERARVAKMASILYALAVNPNYGRSKDKKSTNGNPLDQGIPFMISKDE